MTMYQLVNITVPVSGTCPACKQLNHATLAAQAPEGGNTAHGEATASCGACGATVQMTGSATTS